MTMMNTIKILMMGAAAAMMAACSNNKFHVDGELTGAADSVLYFEHIGLSGIEETGRLTLDEDGRFSFSGEAPEAPEFNDDF